MAKVVDSTALTFDDVLLVPQYSEIISRSDVNTATSLAGIQLNIPILSANMDTVTEWRMAEAMARLGGLGIIHRFMPIEEESKQIVKVKRADNMVIRDPIRISPTSSLREARELMAYYQIGGIMVVDAENRLLGILTNRDILFSPDETLVQDCMTPRPKLVVAGEEVRIPGAKQMFMKYKVEKLPIINEMDKLVGLITAKDMVKLETNPQALKDDEGNLLVGAAVGTREDDIERCERLFQAGVDFLVVDIAHGHSSQMVDMVRLIRKCYPHVKIIAGNVATYEGTLDLLKAGADVVKIGVGSGSICITRIVTGFGVPQLTAVMEGARACKDFGHGEIIADGGIRQAGDIVKALAAGANAVMIGNLVSGTDEAPGRAIVKNGKKYKGIRGMASLSANISRKKANEEPVTEEAFDKIVPEGVEAFVPYKGAVDEIIYQLVGGLRSGLSYAGAHTIRELQENAVFTRITTAGKAESGPHDLEMIV